MPKAPISPRQTAIARRVPYRRETSGRGEREDAHAQDRDRREEAGDRVRDVEIVLDLRDQRSDADDLRPQREPGEEQPREQAEPAMHA